MPLRERLLTPFQLENALADGGLTDPGRPGDGSHATMTQQKRLSRQQ